MRRSNGLFFWLSTEFTKAALVVIEAITKDDKGKPMFRNRVSAFIRGIGGWGGERGPKTPE